MPRSSAVRNRYCGQVSAKIVRPCAARPADLLDRLAARHVHDQDRHVDQFGQRDRAVRGFALDQHRPRMRRGSAARCGRRPRAAAWSASRCSRRSRRGSSPSRRARRATVEHVEDLAVVELQVVVGHVDLERGVALGDQRRQFLVQHRRRRVADDQVEGVVDMRPCLRRAGGSRRRRRAATAPLACAANGITVVVPPQAAERVPLSKSSAMRTGGGIGWSRWQWRVDAAGRDDAAGGVDLARRGGQALRQRDDAPAGDADVAVEGVARGGNAACARRGRAASLRRHLLEHAPRLVFSAGPLTCVRREPLASTSRQCSANSSACAPARCLDCRRPNTMRPTPLQYIAPAHIGQGSPLA